MPPLGFVKAAGGELFGFDFGLEALGADGAVELFDPEKDAAVAGDRAKPQPGLCS